MKETTINKLLGVFCVLAVCASALLLYQTSRNIEIVQKLNDCKEQVSAQAFDTSPLLGWCGEESFPDGEVRMIGAWPVYQDGTTWEVESEDGHVWQVESETMEGNDFLLLWIADNHTPDNYTDDMIIKVWKEAY